MIFHGFCCRFPEATKWGARLGLTNHSNLKISPKVWRLTQDIVWWKERYQYCDLSVCRNAIKLWKLRKCRKKQSRFCIVLQTIAIELRPKKPQLVKRYVSSDRLSCSWSQSCKHTIWKQHLKNCPSIEKKPILDLLTDLNAKYLLSVSCQRYWIFLLVVYGVTDVWASSYPYSGGVSGADWIYKGLCKQSTNLQEKFTQSMCKTQPQQETCGKIM